MRSRSDVSSVLRIKRCNGKAVTRAHAPYRATLIIGPFRFNGPETVADVPVEGHEMYYQAVLGCRDFQLDFLEWTDNV
jgi:hypothetical protein